MVMIILCMDRPVLTRANDFKPFLQCMFPVALRKHKHTMRAEPLTFCFTILAAKAAERSTIGKQIW